MCAMLCWDSKTLGWFLCWWHSVTFMSPINFKTGQPVNTKTTQILAHCVTGKKEEKQKEGDTMPFLLNAWRVKEKMHETVHGNVYSKWFTFKHIRLTGYPQISLSFTWIICFCYRYWGLCFKKIFIMQDFLSFRRELAFKLLDNVKDK